MFKSEMCFKPQMKVSFPHTQQADSENLLEEVSLQKPDIMVCCNLREGGSGGNALFCKDFCTAARLVCLCFSGFSALYFCTAARLICLYFSGFSALYFCTAARLICLYFSGFSKLYFCTAARLVCLYFSGFSKLYFCTATRFLCLKFALCLSWYFLTAIKLDNFFLFSFTSKSIFSKIDIKFEQERQM